MPFVDDALSQAIDETIAGEFDMLLGRRTYEIFAAYWPNQVDNPIGKAFNKATKYVVTHSLDFNERERISVFQNTGSGRASRGMEIRLWQEL